MKTGLKIIIMIGITVHEYYISSFNKQVYISKGNVPEEINSILVAPAIATRWS